MPPISCYDLAENKSGNELDIIFPGFNSHRESVVFLSPHDDDAALGAGYLILACRSAKVDAHVVVLCDGRAGYTKTELKETIVDIRRSETKLAYAKLGVAKDRIHCFEYPDFSLQAYLAFELPDGTEGAFGKIIKLLRQIRATRLVIPNGWMEHPDHTAAYEIGAFHGPQAGDPILPDRGAPSLIKSYISYAVWGDLPPPENRENRGHNTHFRGENSFVSPVFRRADLMLVAPRSFEKKVAESLKCFRSQSDIIEGLLRAREGRVRGNKAIEVYRRLTPRSTLDYKPYWDIVDKFV